MKKIISTEFSEHIKSFKLAMNDLSSQIEEAANLCIKSINNGGKIILIGNGGSAADAQHIAAELVGRYKLERNPIPAIALTTDSSVITAISNDFGYANVFDRQVEALANKNDVLIGISTSGKSINILNALKTANKKGCKTISLGGGSGGLLKQICNVSIIVPSKDTARIQEMHIFIGHTICHLIEINNNS
jgi:D-sedoheptulose 7-phosphate isomerase